MSTPRQQTPEEKPNAEAAEHPSPPAAAEAADNEEKKEEEEGECGFCIWMKGGGCKEEFIAWENCVQEAENNNEDLVEKCAPVTAALKKCMEAHADYYEPILRAEKDAEKQARAELENEKQQSEDQEKEKVPPAPSNQN